MFKMSQRRVISGGRNWRWRGKAHQRNRCGAAGCVAHVGLSWVSREPPAALGWEKMPRSRPASGCDPGLCKPKQGGTQYVLEWETCKGKLESWNDVACGVGSVLASD